MRLADDYAFEAEKRVSRSEDGSLARAQVWATLALAAATLEAARLMGPTPEDQARLDALMSKPMAESDRYDDSGRYDDGSLRPQWG